LERIAFDERPDWRDDAERCGFAFHTIDGEAYWDETHAYRFSLAEIETELEDPTQELLSLCYQAVDRILGDDALMERMAIPEEFHQPARDSWPRPSRKRRLDLPTQAPSTDTEHPRGAHAAE